MTSKLFTSLEIHYPNYIPITSTTSIKNPHPKDCALFFIIPSIAILFIKYDSSLDDNLMSSSDEEDSYDVMA